MDDRTLELIQTELDGDCTPAERERLREILAGNPAAREALAELRRVHEALPAARGVDPPEELGGTRGIRSSGVPFLARWREGDLLASSKGRFLAVAAIAAVTAVVAWFGFVKQPAEGDDSATIGAAKEDQSEQISTQDVVLGDTSTRALLRSDAFDRLIRDPEARKVLASAEFIAVATNPEFARFAQNPELARLAQSSEYQALAATPEFQRLAQSASFQKLVTNPDFAKLAANPDFAKAIATPDYARRLAGDVD